MSQLWSVSANIAAYASEGAKQPQRAPRKLEIERAARELEKMTRPDASSQLTSCLAASAPSLSLFTSSRQNPQVSLQEALHAYEENQDEKD